MPQNTEKNTNELALLNELKKIAPKTQLKEITAFYQHYIVSDKADCQVDRTSKSKVFNHLFTFLTKLESLNTTSCE